MARYKPYIDADAVQEMSRIQWREIEIIRRRASEKPINPIIEVQ